jgi:glycosyltransferase involved in cell wall biosynthesis
MPLADLPARPGGQAGSGPQATALTGPLRIATVIARLEGGAGLQALRGACALDPDSFEVTLITGRGDHLLAAAGQAGVRTRLEPALRHELDPVRDGQAVRRLTSLFLENRFDVVHTHGAKAGAVGRPAARRAGVPRVVHTYHGFPFHEFQSVLRRSAYVAIERRLARVTDLVLCTGTAVAAEAVRRGLADPGRVRAIGVAVPGAEDKTVPDRNNPQARARARLALGLPADATVVGAVGRLTYQKAPEDFIAALRRLGPGVTGVWIGDGELAGRVTRLARTVPGGNVLFPGERQDVPDLLPALDVFVLPSRYEGLPTVVVEAMLAGVPVVATAVNAVTDLVIPGETGLLVPPRRPDLLASAVRQLLDSPAEAARMAAAARDRIGARYGVAALRDALEAAYAPGWPPGAGESAVSAGRSSLA